jgi:hypothetical protein
MSDPALHHPRLGAHPNGEPAAGSLAERREARRLRREHRRALRHQAELSAASALPVLHPWVTAGLLIATGVLVGALVSRAALPQRAPGEQLLRRLARQFAL